MSDHAHSLLARLAAADLAALTQAVKEDNPELVTAIAQQAHAKKPPSSLQAKAAS